MTNNEPIRVNEFFNKIFDSKAILLSITFPSYENLFIMLPTSFSSKNLIVVNNIFESNILKTPFAASKFAIANWNDLKSVNISATPVIKIKVSSKF